MHKQEEFVWNNTCMYEGQIKCFHKIEINIE